MPNLRGVVMIVPESVIMVLCLITFVLTYFQYYRLNPRVRTKNLRFAIMACTAACAVSYPVTFALLHARPAFPSISLGYLAGTLLLFGGSILLQLRMPRPDRKP